MQHDAVTLYCPNDLCQAVNPKKNKFCQRCSSPLIKRYLWAIGEGLAGYKLGELVGDRYLLTGHWIMLDTKPGLLPEMPTSEISDATKAYLKLVSYRLQVPQVYGVLTLSDGSVVVLLEQAAIFTEAGSLEGQVMPDLFGSWQDGKSMRQLNWLWQIAQLWEPFSSERVASTLLQPELLRAEGPLVRLLELRFDQASAPTLVSLGQLWKTYLLSQAQYAIKSFLQQICQQLMEGDIHSSEQLLSALDHGLHQVGRSQARVFTIATRTDTGPSRQRNEDACYPAGGTTITLPPEAGEALTIVCDGIGGHEGGDVASNLAIETVHQQVQSLTNLDSTYSESTITLQLERAACAANDRISQRNDRENRQGRQRMGTTLVMALVRAYELYVTHVGDSRAYWITRTGCHQITLDDDVASREVRLGYALYRDALQQVSSGSLIQALGMSPSAALRPTVQRFILDEDCVFLLCSDGLSDYDRVEQCWETEILPILDGKVDLATAGARLVEIGNSQNGHDNVTVCLVYCQVSSFEPESTVSIPAQNLTAPELPVDAKTVVMDGTAKPNPAPSKLKTQLIPPRAPRRRSRLVLVGISLLILGGGLLAYSFRQEFNRWTPFGLSSSSPSVTLSPTNSASPLVPSPTSLPFETVSLSRVNINKGSTSDKILLLRQEKPNKEQRIIGFIPSGSVLHVIQDQTLPEKNRWLQVKVCSTPKATALPTHEPQLGKNGHSLNSKQSQSPLRKPGLSPPKSYLPVPPGKQGWIKQAEIADFIEPSGLGNCSVTPTSQSTALQEGVSFDSTNSLTSKVEQ